MPESADFVMFWWHPAAGLTRRGEVQRFGFITTNSLKQTFNRRVLKQHLNAEPPLSIVWAIPDHPWVDAASGAEDDAVHVVLAAKIVRIHADLTVGADVAGAKALQANIRLSGMGVKLHGQGFVVTSDQARVFGLGTAPKLESYIRPYVTSRGLAQIARGDWVIDLCGLSAEEARQRYPAVYQWLLERVKPERDAKAHSADGAAYAKLWWLFGKPRTELRKALFGLKRFIATPRTAKHRVFLFLEYPSVAESEVVCIATDDAYFLGILSSQPHVTWSLAAGGRLGVGNDPRYNNSRCFDPFPFPAASPEQQTRIAALAEQLDTHRKRQQAAHPGLTLTGMYNVLAKLRSDETLSAKDKTIHETGLIAVLRQLHDELDAAVLEAYGWQDLAPGATNTLLERLVALNAERSREEATGHIRWLRPDFQNPSAVPQGDFVPGAVDRQEQAKMDLPQKPASTATAPAEKRPWPATLPEQVRAIADALTPTPQDEPALAARFTGKGPWKKRLPEILAMLAALGRAKRSDGGWVG